MTANHGGWYPYAGWHWFESFNSSGRNLTVRGFEFLARVRTPAPQLLNTGIFVAGGSPGSFRQVAKGTILVDQNSRRWQTFMDQAVTIPNNGFFSVGIQSRGHSTLHPWAASSASVTYYRQGDPRNPKSDRFAWNVLCGTQGVDPRIGTTGRPKISTTFSVDLDRARPNAVSAFALGTKFGPLAIGGAAGCSLLVQPALVLPSSTGSAGTQSIPITLPLDTSMRGKSFSAQFFVTEPTVNALGVVATAAVDATIG